MGGEDSTNTTPYITVAKTEYTKRLGQDIAKYQKSDIRKYQKSVLSWL